jgi:hypothetical protein
MSIVTEAEAIEKLCPFMTKGMARYQGGSDWQHINCVGSKCMAWRWHNKPAEKERLGFCGLPYVASIPSAWLDK